MQNWNQKHSGKVNPPLNVPTSTNIEDIILNWSSAIEAAPRGKQEYFTN